MRSLSGIGHPTSRVCKTGCITIKNHAIYMTPMEGCDICGGARFIYPVVGGKVEYSRVVACPCTKHAGQGYTPSYNAVPRIATVDTLASLERRIELLEDEQVPVTYIEPEPSSPLPLNEVPDGVTPEMFFLLTKRVDNLIKANISRHERAVQSAKVEPPF